MLTISSRVQISLELETNTMVVQSMVNLTETLVVQNRKILKIDGEVNSKITMTNILVVLADNPKNKITSINNQPINYYLDKE